MGSIRASYPVSLSVVARSRWPRALGSLHPADQAALERLFTARPSWTGIARARDVINLDGKVLLHSGPPFAGAPIVNAIVSTTKEGNWAYVKAPFILGIALAALGGYLVTKNPPKPPTKAETPAKT